MSNYFSITNLKEFRRRKKRMSVTYWARTLQDFDNKIANSAEREHPKSVSGLDAYSKPKRNFINQKIARLELLVLLFQDKRTSVYSLIAHKPHQYPSLSISLHSLLDFWILDV